MAGLALASVLAACGLPDVVPQIKQPTLSVISPDVYMLRSADYRTDGAPFTIYGLDIYYRVYKNADAAARLAADYQSLSAITGNPRGTLSNLGWTHVARQGQSATTSDSPPTISISPDNLVGGQYWSFTIDGSLGAIQAGAIDVYVGQTIGSSPTKLYRLVAATAGGAWKGFTAAELDLSLDADLKNRSDLVGLSSADAAVGVMVFVFAQDVDSAYLPMYSLPVALGPFRIK